MHYGIDAATECDVRSRSNVDCAGFTFQFTLTFAIIGGGPTGVELAGALSELARRTLPPDQARILLLEAGPRILPSFPNRLSEIARRALTRRGIEVVTGTKVEDVREGAIVAGGRRIDIGGAILWAAGVRSSPAGRWLDAPCDHSGRARVEPNLAAPGRPNVFIVGDAAAAVGPDGSEAPGLAPAAKQMGRYVARVIRARLEGRPEPGPFRYRDQGSLATIGRNAALVKIGSLSFTGFPGWVFWSVAHIYFLIGARSRFFVALKLGVELRGLPARRPPDHAALSVPVVVDPWYETRRGALRHDSKREALA